MQTIKEALEHLQKVTNSKITQEELGKALGTGRANISLRIKNNSELTLPEIKKIEKYFGVNYTEFHILDLEEINKLNADTVQITYRPDVFLSAGYGVEVLDETKETMTLDARLLTTERGYRINPQHCEIVSVSGNSMAPEYRHGDKVIIDRGDTELVDGHIFAFRYNGQCYVKEINLLGDKIKCISLNKEYDPFYINQGEQFTVLGRIIPRIRL